MFSEVSISSFVCFFFFFQAEDGIRDVAVTGVQTCALPIFQGQIHPPTPRPQERNAPTAAIKDYSRPEDDTYLSYPEWYIVWSYQEKADFQEKHLPSGFPYLGAVSQYWNSYCCISRLTRGKYA